MDLLQLFKCLNHLGVCQGSSATLRNVDTVVCEGEADLKHWQEEAEADMTDELKADMSVETYVDNAMETYDEAVGK